MKLFSPSEARELNTAQNNRDRIRTTELQQELTRKQILLADAEASFNSALARQRDIWALEEKNYADRYFSMELEVKNLEKRKEESLIPIAEMEEKVHTLLNEAESRLSEVNQKETEVEEIKIELMKRLDDISEKEISLKDEELALIKRKYAIKQEEGALSANRHSLSESIIKFNLYIQEQQDIVSREKTDLLLRERSIEARNRLLDKREKRLEADIIRLNDGQQTLQRAFARINMNPNDAINYPNVEVEAGANGSNQPVTATPEIEVTEPETVSSTEDVQEELEETSIDPEAPSEEETVSEVTE